MSTRPSLWCKPSLVEQETQLNEEIQALEQEIARLENNPDKKIKAVVGGRCVVVLKLGIRATPRAWSNSFYLRHV